jgi:parallel beta-helix repeat protein
VNGIILGDSNTNNIIGNTLYNNGYGIELKSYKMACFDNIICQNNFINSTYQQASTDSNSTWDYKNKGNYWSDYNGTDANEDGIGDTPYFIQGGSNKDNYPLMKKVEKADVIVAPPKDKKEAANGGFLPGFEVAALLFAVGVGMFLITLKRKKKAS